MSGLGRLWRGELPLSDAFWNWAVIGGLALNISTSVLFLILIMAGYPITALIVGYVPTLPYNSIVIVGVWRSANNYAGDKRWADLARVVTVIGMVLLTIT